MRVIDLLFGTIMLLSLTVFALSIYNMGHNALPPLW